ncbi:MAG: ATP-binding cassette domain-containing protein [Oscillospiraceae bacterium]|jgi:ABC-type lipoprotein export system ATPase subunit
MKSMTIKRLFDKHPYSKDFFDINALPVENENITIEKYIAALPYVFLEDMGIDREGLLLRFYSYMNRMESIREDHSLVINDITVFGGNDKSGQPESIELKIKSGEIVCIVGPTGSGKSRLLADIEWMAQKDTPTRRQILINSSPPPKEWRFSIEHKLVAQLSQNMNFVMDICVGEFIKLHAQSRMTDDIPEKTDKIITSANELSGEAFDLSTPLTSLSGGQSRALMVADTAFLSASPIVLIDEIENAGINRKKALELLSGQNKIILIATHDPLLALMGEKRIIIKNGGIRKVISTSQAERESLERLIIIDDEMQKCREALRSGYVLGDFKLSSF